MSMDPLPRVLSIQSHVVSGYVGNRAAVFPLQIRGFEVDFINSVQFSNHTGYPSFTGQVLAGTELQVLVEGLEKNYLQNYDYVLTGYIGSESFLTSVLASVDSVLRANPKARFVCDPVLGDEGQYYVPKELVAIYKERVIPRAFMITPNQFEAELLTGMRIVTLEDAQRVCHMLQAMGPAVVVLTSCEVVERPGVLVCLSLSAAGMHMVVVDKLKGRFTGTGDVTAALLLGWGHCTGGFTDMSQALSKTMGTIRAIIQLTRAKKGHLLSKADQAEVEGGNLSPSCRSRYMRNSELCLIESVSIISDPPNCPSPSLVDN